MKLLRWNRFEKFFIIKCQPFGCPRGVKFGKWAGLTNLNQPSNPALIYCPNTSTFHTLFHPFSSIPLPSSTHSHSCPLSYLSSSPSLPSSLHPFPIFVPPFNPLHMSKFSIYILDDLICWSRSQQFLLPDAQRQSKGKQNYAMTSITKHNRKKKREADAREKLWKTNTVKLTSTAA